MTPHQTIAVAVRLFAIWLAITLVSNLITFNSQFTWQEYPNKLFATVLILTVIALVALALWFFPLTVARGLLTAASPQPARASPSASPDTWLAIGCALLGLWVLTAALPALVRESIILNSSDFATDTSEVRHWLIYHLGQVVIGIWLTLGAKGFRGLFWWARNAGIGKPSN
jgi:hypothetical protein